MSNYILAGGGTGGHLFPGLAVVSQIKKQQPKLKPHFIGVKTGIEARIIPKLNYPLYFVNISGAYGKSTIELLKLIYKIPFSIIQTLVLFIKIKPKFIISVGGYASFPAVIASIIAFRRLYIIEQNIIGGIVNRYFKAFATIYFCPAVGKNTKKKIKPNIKIVGYPLRIEIEDLAQKSNIDQLKNQKQPTLLIIGGSQGANKINQIIFNYLNNFDNSLLYNKKLKNNKLHIIHQTGDSDFKLAMNIINNNNLLKSSNLKYEPFKFIDNIAKYYLKSTLIICRGGAGIFEITAVGRGMIIIPISKSSGNHQYKNSQFFKNNGASIHIDEDKFSIFNLDFIFDLLLNSNYNNKIVKMAESSRKLYQADCAKNIARMILS